MQEEKKKKKLSIKLSLFLPILYLHQRNTEFSGTSTVQQKTNEEKDFYCYFAGYHLSLTFPSLVVRNVSSKRLNRYTYLFITARKKNNVGLLSELTVANTTQTM